MHTAPLPAAARLNNLKSFAISVVSHGHGAQVEALLAAISNCTDALPEKVIVTVNAPSLDAGCFEQPAASFPFTLCVIKNDHPMGFGANHNQAFQQCSSDCFFVLNPDLDLPTNPFPALLIALSGSHTGCAYPIQTSTQGELQDFERDLPTPSAILKRRFPGARRQLKADLRAQWVSGAFMAFDASVFRRLGGFDERYFMYCEDVDICLRLQLAGYPLTKADTTVIHHAQRQSAKNWRHLAWHVRSLLRLWRSASYREYRRRFPDGNSQSG
jgi:N-acetylglucosaminyl-diphospho-decaprenol L-rhamnosyltransferase